MSDTNLLIEQIDQWRKDYASLSEECQYVKNQWAESQRRLDHLKESHAKVSTERENLWREINRRDAAVIANPKGWPLIPVNPDCIPKGYRVVKCDTPKPTDVVVSSSCIPRLFGSIDYPRLIVEADVIPKPTPPPWLNPEWYFAMDSNGEWWAYPEKPIHDDTKWFVIGLGKIPLYTIDSLDQSRWKECCWRVGELA